WSITVICRFQLWRLRIYCATNKDAGLSDNRHKRESVGKHMAQVEEKTVDLRIRRTKKMLQGAFLALMSEKPFADITVQDITERAMVNRGTFYDHFADKQALADYTLRQMFRGVLNRTLPADFAF